MSKKEKGTTNLGSTMDNNNKNTDSYSTANIKHYRRMVIAMIAMPLVVAGLVFATLYNRNTESQEISAASVNPSKQEVLNYLSGLSNTNGSNNKFIAGQHVGQTSNYQDADRGTALIEDMAPLTGGEYIGMVGADLGGGSSLSTGLSDYLIDYWKKGGLVTLSWHRKNPATNGTEKDRSVDPLPSILASGSNATKTRFYEQLDSAAVSLKRLKDNGVVVIYRPFHEMTINAFWWGCRNQSQYMQMWQKEYDYLTNTKGLNNLIWVWNPHRSHSCTDKPHLSFYPGSNYVDVVGADAYECINASSKIWGGSGLDTLYNQLGTLGKPISFPEVGESRSSCRLGTYSDYRSIFNTINSKYPKVSYFIVWNADMSYKYNDKQVNSVYTSRAALKDSAVISRGEMSIFNNSTPTPTPTPDPSPAPPPSSTPTPTPTPDPSPAPPPSSTPTPTPTPANPTPPPPVTIPDSNSEEPVKIPDDIAKEEDGTIIADFTGDGLNERVIDSNNDGFIDPKTEIIEDSQTNPNLTDTTQAPISTGEYKQLKENLASPSLNSQTTSPTTDPNTITIKAGPLPETKINKPVAYTFVAMQGIAALGLASYLAITKLSIFAGIRGKLGL